jgi:K+ transporter
MQRYRRKFTKLLLAIAISFSVAMMFSIISIIFAMTTTTVGWLFGPLCAINAVVTYVIGFVNIFRLQQHSI